MGAVNEITIYLLQTAIGIYLLIMLMRFILQLSLADFYNPISQFLVRATNPLVVPLRRILPARRQPKAAPSGTAPQLRQLGRDQRPERCSGVALFTSVKPKSSPLKRSGSSLTEANA